MKYILSWLIFIITYCTSAQVIAQARTIPPKIIPCDACKDQAPDSVIDVLNCDTLPFTRVE